MQINYEFRHFYWLIPGYAFRNDEIKHVNPTKYSNPQKPLQNKQYNLNISSSNQHPQNKITARL